jgi:trimethyllysine dioxygenase
MAKKTGRFAGGLYMTATLHDARLEGENVELSFGEGRQALRLPLLWLRDHCPSTHHPQTRQRVADTFNIPAGIRARSVRVESQGRGLRVEWAQEDHVSCFPAEFLAGLRRDPEVLAVVRRTWDADSIRRELPQVPYEAMLGDEATLREFLERLERYGFCFVEGVPATPEATRGVANRIAYVRQTVFGGYWDFTANLEHKDTAYTSAAIGPHTDGTYSLDAPGYQMFHCLAAECEGGENVLIDGFRVAEIMRAGHPEDYRLLTEIAVPGQYRDEDRGIHLIARRPLFRLNDAGELVQVSYNNHDRAPFLLPAPQLKAFYAALGVFARLCADSALHYRRRLLPGSVLLFDNWRVLHARDAYRGYRRLAGVYLNKEDIESRLRVLRTRGPAANGRGG